MANTWRATSQGVAYASAKSMIDLYNATGTARVIRVYRMYHFNNGTAAVTGVITTMRINRLTAGTPTGGSTITPVAHDTDNSALDANTTAGTGRTPTTRTLLRQYIYSNDEASSGSSTLDEWEIFVPFAQVWDAGYGDSNVQALTARSNQGYEIQQSGVSAVGTADLEIEFTDAAS